MLEALQISSKTQNDVQFFLSLLRVESDSDELTAAFCSQDVFLTQRPPNASTCKSFCGHHSNLPREECFKLLLPRGGQWKRGTRRVGKMMVVHDSERCESSCQCSGGRAEKKDWILCLV